MAGAVEAAGLGRAHAAQRSHLSVCLQPGAPPFGLDRRGTRRPVRTCPLIASSQRRALPLVRQHGQGVWGGAGGGLAGLGSAGHACATPGTR